MNFLQTADSDIIVSLHLVIPFISMFETIKKVSIEIMFPQAIWTQVIGQGLLLKYIILK